MSADYQSHQVTVDSSLDTIGTKERTKLDLVIDGINSALRFPLRIRAGYPLPDTKLYIEPSKLTMADGSEVSLVSIKNKISDISLSWIDFTTGEVSSDVFEGATLSNGKYYVTLPTANTVGFYVICGLTFNSGKIQLKWSDETVSLLTLPDVSSLIKGDYPLGWLTLESYDVKSYKTLGSIKPLIEASTNNIARIHRSSFTTSADKGIEKYKTLDLLKAAVNCKDDDHAFCIETETFYRYESTELATIPSDDQYVVSVTSDSAARWKGVAGKFTYATPNTFMIRRLRLTSKTSGQFLTGFIGTPIVTLRHFKAATTTFSLLENSKYVSVNGDGSILNYNFTSYTATIASGDYVEIQAYYPDYIISRSNEFDSNWIKVSDINNKKLGLTTAGWHEIQLPSSFESYPAGLTVLQKRGSNVAVVDSSSLALMSMQNNLCIVDLNVSKFQSDDYVRVFASRSPRPVGTRLNNSLTMNATYAVAVDDDFIRANALTSNVVWTLPSASLCTGKLKSFKKEDSSSYTITIKVLTGETIEGASTYVLSSKGDSVNLLAFDSSSFSIVNKQSNILRGDELYIKGNPAAFVPVGGVIYVAYEGGCPNFLDCDGSALNRTTYSDLFNKIRTTWGIGDGSTTFNIPDIRGVGIRVADGQAGRDPDKLSRNALVAYSFQLTCILTSGSSIVQLSGGTTANLAIGQSVAIQGNSSFAAVGSIIDDTHFTIRDKANSAPYPSTVSGAYVLVFSQVSGNYVGTYQADELKSHNHYYYRDMSEGWSNLGAMGQTHDSYEPTSYTGGTETRMKNISLRAMIRYI